MALVGAMVNETPGNGWGLLGGERLSGRTTSSFMQQAVLLDHGL